MNIIVYDPTTGSIYGRMSFPDDEYDTFIKNNIPTNRDFVVIDEFVDLDTHYVDQSKAIQPREHQPTPYHRWINYEWVLDAAAQYQGESENVRADRDRLLASSDWTDTLSSKNRLGEDLYNQWQAYRQALRDVPEQAGFPLAIVWPTPPE